MDFISDEALQALSARRQYLDGVHAGARQPPVVDVAVRPASVAYP